MKVARTESEDQKLREFFQRRQKLYPRGFERSIDLTDDDDYVPTVKKQNVRPQQPLNLPPPTPPVTPPPAQPPPPKNEDKNGEPEISFPDDIYPGSEPSPKKPDHVTVDTGDVVKHKNPLTSTPKDVRDYTVAPEDPKTSFIRTDEKTGQVVETRKMRDSKTRKWEIKSFPISVITSLDQIKELLVKMHKSRQMFTIQFRGQDGAERTMNGRVAGQEPFLQSGKGLRVQLSENIPQKKKVANPGDQATEEPKVTTQLRTPYLYGIQYMRIGGKLYVVDLDKSNPQHAGAFDIPKTSFVSQAVEKARKANQFYKSPQEQKQQETSSKEADTILGRFLDKFASFSL